MMQQQQHRIKRCRSPERRKVQGAVQLPTIALAAKYAVDLAMDLHKLLFSNILTTGANAVSPLKGSPEAAVQGDDSKTALARCQRRRHCDVDLVGLGLDKISVAVHSLHQHRDESEQQPPGSMKPGSSTSTQGGAPGLFSPRTAVGGGDDGCSSHDIADDDDDDAAIAWYRCQRVLEALDSLSEGVALQLTVPRSPNDDDQDERNKKDLLAVLRRLLLGAGGGNGSGRVDGDGDQGVLSPTSSVALTIDVAGGHDRKSLPVVRLTVSKLFQALPVRREYYQRGRQRVAAQRDLAALSRYLSLRSIGQIRRIEEEEEELSCGGPTPTPTTTTAAVGEGPPPSQLVAPLETFALRHNGIQIAAPVVPIVHGKLGVCVNYTPQSLVDDELEESETCRLFGNYCGQARQLKVPRRPALRRGGPTVASTTTTAAAAAAVDDDEDDELANTNTTPSPPPAQQRQLLAAGYIGYAQVSTAGEMLTRSGVMRSGLEVDASAAKKAAPNVYLQIPQPPPPATSGEDTKGYSCGFGVGHGGHRFLVRLLPRTGSLSSSLQGLLDKPSLELLLSSPPQPPLPLGQPPLLSNVLFVLTDEAAARFLWLPPEGTVGAGDIVDAIVDADEDTRLQLQREISQAVNRTCAPESGLPSDVSDARLIAFPRRIRHTVVAPTVAVCLLSREKDAAGLGPNGDAEHHLGVLTNHTPPCASTTTSTTTSTNRCSHQFVLVEPTATTSTPPSTPEEEEEEVVRVRCGTIDAFAAEGVDTDCLDFRRFLPV